VGSSIVFSPSDRDDRDERPAGRGERLAVDDRPGTIGCGDDHVRRRERAGEIVQSDRSRSAGGLAGDMLGVGYRPVCHHEIRDALGEVRGCERPHLACANDESGCVPDVLVLRCSQANGGAGQGDDPFVDGGLGAGPLADADRLRHAVVEHRPDPADAPGVLVGVPDLAEDLVLANDQRLEPGGDAQQVSETLGVTHPGRDVRRRVFDEL
jgi:hypothetical protein